MPLRMGQGKRQCFPEGYFHGGNGLSKGKKEFYIGWTMNETPSFGLSFVQLRAAWYEWVGGLTAAGAIYLIINTVT